MFVATFIGVVVLWLVGREIVLTFLATPARLNDPAYSSLWRPMVGGLVTGFSAAFWCTHEKWFVDEGRGEHSPEVER